MQVGAPKSRSMRGQPASSHPCCAKTARTGRSAMTTAEPGSSGPKRRHPLDGGQPPASRAIPGFPASICRQHQQPGGARQSQLQTVDRARRPAQDPTRAPTTRGINGDSCVCSVCVGESSEEAAALSRVAQECWNEGPGRRSRPAHPCSTSLALFQKEHVEAHGYAVVED